MPDVSDMDEETCDDCGEYEDECTCSDDEFEDEDGEDEDGEDEDEV